MTDITELKKQAAYKAVDYVQSGMKVGLGSGSTAIWVTRRIGELLKSGDLTDIVGVPSSVRTEEEAVAVGVPLTSLGETPRLDIAIDGADEIDPKLNLIKGGGGALLREKIVAQASDRFIIVADSSKQVATLGKFALPVEVVTFAYKATLAFLEALAGKAELRTGDDGHPFITDQGNYIIDCHFGAIDDPQALGLTLADRAGIVEHGLFIGMAEEAIVAGESVVVVKPEL